MKDDQFEKRMNLLKDSFERVPSSFDPEEVIQKIKETPQKAHLEIPKAQKSHKFLRNMLVLGAAAASLFLIIILSTAYFATEQDERAADQHGKLNEAALLAFENEYEEAREKKRHALELTEEQFSTIQFVERTDKNVRHLLKTGMLTTGNQQELLKDRLDELALPSELAEDLRDNQRQEDQEASLAFVAHYRNQVNDLLDFYHMLFTSEDNMKEPILSAMTKQHIQYITTNPKMPNKTIDLQLAESKEMKAALHEDVQAYYDMLLREPYTVGASLIYSLEDTTEIVQDMEVALIATKEESHLYLVMRGYYVMLFNQLVIGTPEEPVFNEQGIVNERYQKVWTQLAHTKDNTPTSFIMRPIVEEMEASGWKKSASLDTFNHQEIEGMLELAENGMLPN